MIVGGMPSGKKGIFSYNECDILRSGKNRMDNDGDDDDNYNWWW